MKMGERVDSDHHPVEVRIRGEGKREDAKKGNRKGWRDTWDEEGCRLFKERMIGEDGR